MESAVYTGTLRHRRFAPVRHEFTYPVFQVMLDIDRIPELMRLAWFTGYNRFNWASFYECDHFGDPSLPLRERVEQDAASQGIELPHGPIFLLTNLRYLGYCFNPISFYYCYDREGNLAATLTEVNSTFGEQHNYWLIGAERHRNSFHYVRSKQMHVSPFLKMDMEYRFVLTPPGDRLTAHIDTMRGEERMLDATLTLEREPWTATAFGRVLRRFPMMTAKVIGAIHWEALKLYRKHVPFIPHPGAQG